MKSKLLLVITILAFSQVAKAQLIPWYTTGNSVFGGLLGTTASQLDFIAGSTTPSRS